MWNPYYIEQPNYSQQSAAQQQNPNFPSWGSQNVSGYGDSNIEGTDWSSSNQSGGFGQWANSQDWGQGISSGLSAGAANSQPVGDFNIDQYAGFKGSGQGLMSDGAIGAIIGGVGAQYGQFKKVNENLKKLDTSVNGTRFDMYGRPIYDGSAFNQANKNVKSLDEGINKLNKTHLDPITNLASTFTGTRRRMKRKREELLKNIKQQQAGYNQSDIDFRNRMAAEDTYRDSINNNNRYYNLFRFRS